MNGAGRTLYGAGRTLYGAGRTLYGAGRTLYGAGRTLYGAGRTCYVRSVAVGSGPACAHWLADIKVWTLASCSIYTSISFKIVLA